MPMNDDEAEAIARKVIKEMIHEMKPEERRRFEETIKRIHECAEELRSERRRSEN